MYAVLPEPVYEENEKVIFHFIAKEWPLDHRRYNPNAARKIDNTVCTVCFSMYMLESNYYILKELPHTWIKESHLESIRPQITDSEFENLIEV